MSKKYPLEITRALEALKSKESKKLIKLIHDKKEISFEMLVEETHFEGDLVNSNLKLFLKSGLIDYSTGCFAPFLYELSSFGKDVYKALGLNKIKNI